MINESFDLTGSIYFLGLVFRSKSAMLNSLSSNDSPQRYDTKISLLLVNDIPLEEKLLHMELFLQRRRMREITVSFVTPYPDTLMTLIYVLSPGFNDDNSCFCNSLKNKLSKEFLNIDKAS